MTSTSGSQSLPIGYDANGNLATQGTSNYAFDAENRLKTRSVSGGNVTYVYDGMGGLLKRTNADGTWTVYIGGVYEKTNAATVTKYYSVHGRTIAMRQIPTGGGSGTLYYLLTDQIGTTSAVTGSTRTVLTSAKYWPYGTVRTGGVTQTDKLFTGQQTEPGDSALGLYNYKARFYSTTLGRFASVDPVAGRESQPQSWKAYTYVTGNPLRFVDPTGMTCKFSLGGIKGCAEDAGSAISSGFDRARDVVNATPGVLWDGVTGGLDLGIRTVQTAANAVADSSIAATGAARDYGAAAAAATYDLGRDSRADVKDAATDIWNHPGATPGILVGTAIALTSWGDRRREGGATVYENCLGTCSFRLSFSNTDAFTVGHAVFGDDEVRGPLLVHELTHVRQYDRDALFPLKYLWDLRDGESQYEREARCTAGQQVQGC